MAGPSLYCLLKLKFLVFCDGFVYLFCEPFLLLFISVVLCTFFFFFLAFFLSVTIYLRFSVLEFSRSLCDLDNSFFWGGFVFSFKPTQM